MYKSKEEVLQKMREIASVMEQKGQKAEELKASVLMDRARLEELKNLYDMFEAKEKELEELFREPTKKVYQNEEGTLNYDLHRKLDDPSVLLLYERYKDREAFEVGHCSTPYFKELISTLPNYLDGEPQVSEYELVAFD